MSLTSLSAANLKDSCQLLYFVLAACSDGFVRCVLSFFRSTPPKIRRVQRVILVSGLFVMRISYASFFPCLKFDLKYYWLI